MNSKYDGRIERDFLAEGYRVARVYENTKLYRRNNTLVLASVDEEGKLEVLVQMNIPPEEVKKKKSWRFWR